MEFTSIYDMIETVNDTVDSAIRENMDQCNAADLGLDPRAGYALYINEDCIAVRNNNRRMLDYYGGFEYVDSEYVQTVGEYTFYFSDDDRVRDHIETYFEKQNEMEDAE